MKASHLVIAWRWPPAPGMSPIGSRGTMSGVSKPIAAPGRLSSVGESMPRRIKAAAKVILIRVWLKVLPVRRGLWRLALLAE